MAKHSPERKRSFSFKKLSPRKKEKIVELTPREELASQIENAMWAFLKERLDEWVKAEKDIKEKDIKEEESKVIDWKGRNIEDILNLEAFNLGAAHDAVLTRIKQAMGVEAQQHADERKKPLSKADWLNIKIDNAFKRAQEHNKGCSSTIRYILRDNAVKETLGELVTAAVENPERVNNVLMAVNYTLHPDEKHSRIEQKKRKFEEMLLEAVSDKEELDKNQKALVTTIAEIIDEQYPIAIADASCMNGIAEALKGDIQGVLDDVTQDNIEEFAETIVVKHAGLLLGYSEESLRIYQDYLNSGLAIAEGKTSDGKEMNPVFVKTLRKESRPLLEQVQWSEWLIEAVESPTLAHIAVANHIAAMLDRNFSEVKPEAENFDQLEELRGAFSDICKKDIDYGEKDAVRNAAEAVFESLAIQKLLVQLQRDARVVKLGDVMEQSKVMDSKTVSNGTRVDNILLRTQSSAEMLKLYGSAIEEAKKDKALPKGLPVGEQKGLSFAAKIEEQKAAAVAPDNGKQHEHVNEFQMVRSLLRPVSPKKLPKVVREEREKMPWGTQVAQKPVDSSLYGGKF